MEGLYFSHYITLIEFCQLKGGIMAQEILKPMLLDETGKEIVTALNAILTQLTAINETLKAKNTDSGTMVVRRHDRKFECRTSRLFFYHTAAVDYVAEYLWWYHCYFSRHRCYHQGNQSCESPG